MGSLLLKRVASAGRVRIGRYYYYHPLVLKSGDLKDGTYVLVKNKEGVAITVTCNPSDATVEFVVFATDLTYNK